MNIGGEKVDNCNWAYYSIKGGKWGCINKRGEIQIPIIYDSSIYFYNKHVATACYNGKDFLINKFGEQIFNDVYDSLKGLFLQNQIVCKNGKYGMIDTNGIFIIPLIYDDITRIELNKSWLIAKVCEKSGIIDINNRVIIPIGYNEIHCNQYVICINYNNKWGILNNKLDTVIPTEYEICQTLWPSPPSPIIVRKNEYYGMLNINISNPDEVSLWNGDLKDIKEIIPCKYDSIYAKSGIEIDSYIQDSFFIIKDNGILYCYQYAIKSKEETNKPKEYIAECIVNFSCESFKCIYENKTYKIYYIFENNGISTITDGRMNIDVLCKKEDVKEVIALSDGCQYVISLSNKILIFNNGCLISHIDNASLCCKQFNKKIYGVKRDKKYAIFTPDMHQCTDFEYDYIDTDDNYDTIEVMKKVYNKCLYGEYSFKTKNLVSFGYLRPRYIRSNYNWAEKYNLSTGKEGIISIKPKNIVIPFKYDYIRFYTGEKSTVLVVSKDFTNPPYRRYALMNTNQDLLTEFIFKKIEHISWNRLDEIECHLLYDDIYSRFYLSLSDINLYIPFLGFQLDVVDKNEEHNGTFKTHSEFVEAYKNVRLYIDTETTGLPKHENTTYKNSDNWPYLVQVAFIIEDDNYGIISKRNIIVKPEGYIIPVSSTNIHGITTEYARKVGIDRKEVMSLLDICMKYANTVIGHNISFDINVIKAEIYREIGDKAFSLKKENSVIDTMILGMDVCKIPNTNYREWKLHPYKYPKLTELYSTLFQRTMKNAHNAMSDIQATYDCYYELIKRQNNKNI